MVDGDVGANGGDAERAQFARTPPPPAQPRPTPDARGDLGKTPFAHLLVYASERRLSGSIELTQADGRASAISLAEGAVTQSRTSEPVAHLGKLLLEMGYVTEAVLDATRERLAEGGRLHGTLLREAGVSDARLREALQAQLALKLDYIFTLPPTTTFAFYNAFNVLEGYGGVEPLTFDLLAVIWRGVCLAPPQEHVEAALRRIEAAPLRLKPGVSIEQLAVADDFIRLVTAMRARPSMVPELITKSGLNASTARLVLYTLLITKQIEPIEAVTMSMPLIQMPTAAALALSAAQSRGISRLTGASPSPPSILSMPAAPSAPAGPPQAAALDLAARRAEIVDLASRIERMDYFQMLDLPHDVEPAAIEARFVELAMRWHPDRLPQPLADMKAPCTRVFGRFSEAQKTLMNPEERARYMRLIKDGGATPEAQAYIARIVEAATTFQKAEVCTKRGDYAQARALCFAAHEADPTQADYLALLAWIESMDPANQSPAATQQRIAMLDRAVAVSPRSERSYFYRGMLYKKLNQMDLAILDFRKTAELNPRNTEAVREVHLYVARKATADAAPKKPEAGPPAGSKISGLLSKLLKK